MALELSRVYRFLKAHKLAKPFSHAVMPSFAALLLGLAWFSQARLYPELKYHLAQAGHPTPVQALELFARRAPANARVLTFYIEIEPLHSALIFLRDYFGRPDIGVYTLSHEASGDRTRGFPLVAITPDMWPQVLDEIDFILWTRRGVKKVGLDRTNAQAMRMIMESEYGINAREIYNDLHYPFHPQIPEGTQIWQIDHEAVRKFRGRTEKAENTSTETGM